MEIQSYLKKQEKFQIKPNVTPKATRERKNKTQKLLEGKKS